MTTKQKNNTPVIRVTQIEAFRRYIQQSEDDNFEITEQSVIDSITGEFKGNEYSRIGTAFHSIIETGHPESTKAEPGERKFIAYGREQTETLPEGRTFSIDGHDITLDTAQCKIALDYRNTHQSAFHEVRLFKRYEDVIVTGQADMIEGTEIRDIKTKYSAIRASDYTNSCQWRFYLDIFNADVFHFDMFQFHGYNIEKHGYDVRGLLLEQKHPSITCYRYERMQEDINILLSQFIEWAKERNLMQYFKSYKQWSSQEK